MDNTLIPPESAPDAAALLDYPASNGFSTNDYHIHRRPGEVMIVRWLQGDEVASFYERMQAHFDTAIAGAREDERQMHEWKQDPVTLQYLDALDAVTLNMAELYRRDPIKQHRVFVLSTLTADEININFLAEHLMGQTAADLVGDAFAPTEAPTNQELAWFFKLFSLRGMHGNQERMCFFTYLQKSDDPFDFD
jgi:hypothetical protein